MALPSLENTANRQERFPRLGCGNSSGDHLKASIARVQGDFKNANCAKDFKDPNAAINKATQVGFSDQGTPNFNSVNGQVVPAAHSPGLGRYNPFTRSINLNAAINWVNPANTNATLSGQPYNYNALAAMANFLGVPSVSGAQLMDITILQELSHYKGAIGNPDNPSVEKSLWNDCIN